MSSTSYIKGLARHLVLSGEMKHTHALQYASQRFGYRTWEAANARLPEFERQLADPELVRIVRTGDGLVITSGAYRQTLPPGSNPYLVFAHSAWLLGMNPGAALGAPLDYIAFFDALEAGIGKTIDIRRASVLDAEQRFLAGVGLKPSLVEWGAPLRAATLGLYLKPWRSGVECRRPGPSSLAIETPGRVSIPWTAPYHSPSGMDWHFYGPSAASLAINAINAYVPPFADGLPVAGAWPEGGASKTALVLYADLTQQVLDVPVEGGTITHKAIDQLIRNSASQMLEAVDPQTIVLRCMDDLTYFSFACRHRDSALRTIGQDRQGLGDRL